MAYYRVYFHELMTEHFTDVLQFHADDDSAAIDQVQAVVSFSFRELWSYGRKVKDFESRQSPT